MSYHLETGDVVDVLQGFNDNSFDALMCDPPYGFSFMGKAWDYDVPSVDLWRECLRVLKPGAPLVAFGGSRTYHRLACGVEDAGFELRDQLMWLYGKGFPKSQNIGLAIDKAAGVERADMYRSTTVGGALSDSHRGTHICNNCGKYYGSAATNCHCPKSKAVSELAKQWDGYGTALKPAFEPIVLARKPLDGTMAQNVARWGVGGLAIDACRIGEAGGTTNSRDRGASPNGIFNDGLNGGKTLSIDAGRWPANLVLDEDAAAQLDAQGPHTKSVKYENNVAEGAVLPFRNRAAGGYVDSGGPSRFFYTAKVSTKERESGCEGLPLRSAGEVTGGREEDSAGLDSPRAGAGRGGGARNHHPTLKPISLTTWLGRLILPPRRDAVVLVPFAGSGSEMIGAAKAGWGGVFGIERDADYVRIAQARLAHWCAERKSA